MPSGRNRGLVQTVLGPVPPSELGATTTHEHLYIDFSFMYRPAQDSPSEKLADAPITLENLGWIRRNYYSNRSNLQLMDLDTATREVRKYSEVGGGAIVDATTTGIGRKPDALAQISRQSGVHIIMGAGFYVEAVHPEDMDERSVEDLAREIIGDIVDGVEGSGVRAGIIGEIGCTWPLAPNECKSLSAAAIAQRETGAAMLVHPGRHPDAPLEILELLASAALDTAERGTSMPPAPAHALRIPDSPVRPPMQSKVLRLGLGRNSERSQTALPAGSTGRR